MANMKRKEIGTNAVFWRRWWDAHSRGVSSNHEADRVSSFHDKEIQQLSEKEFIDFVVPKTTDFVFDGG